MYQKELIYFIFSKKDEDDLFRLKDDPEYISGLQEQDESHTALFDYINTNIKSKEIKEELTNLIDEFTSSIYATNYTSYKLYYYYGFLDGMNFNPK